MFFTYWLYWLYSLFIRPPSPPRQTTIYEPSTSISCPQNSANQEVKVEITIPIIEERIIAPIHHTNMDTDTDTNIDATTKMKTNTNANVNVNTNPADEKLQILFENSKIIEKIRTYGILDEYDYKYIKELSNEQLLILFRNLQ